MKIVIDMNLSPRWAGFLNEVGFDAVHWSCIGVPNALDTEIMIYAKESKSAILTHDLDFGAILAATNGDAPSVVQIRAGDLSPETIGTSIIIALNQSQDALTSGALLTVDPIRTRNNDASDTALKQHLLAPRLFLFRPAAPCHSIHQD